MDEFEISEDQPAKAILVGNVLHSDDESEEIRDLLETAGVEVTGVIEQKRRAVHPKSYVGSGKLKDLTALISELDPDIVVVDDELSPAQQRFLEDATERRVLDRTAVILDIFALHATSAEGKLQVELAQLEYNLSRMRGLWTHLERLGGGIGSRGPGESQLETDRRLARHRITLLRRRLQTVSDQRQRMRQKRSESHIVKVALAGYTNAGKSTLLNVLTGATVSARDRLFETLDPTTRQFSHGGRQLVLTDTVGFIRRLPHQLIDAFAATLEETLASDVVVLVANASLDEQLLHEEIEAVRDVLAEIGADLLPTVVALNKIDTVDPARAQQLAHRFPGSVQISAKTGFGLEALLDCVLAQLEQSTTLARLVIQHRDADLVAMLYRNAEVLERTDDEEGVHLTARIAPAMLENLRGRGAQLVEAARG